VINLLEALRRRAGLALLFISHDLPTVEFLCDRVLVMYLGRVMEIAPAADFQRTPLHPYSRRLVADAPKFGETLRAGAGAVAGETPSPISPPSGCVYDADEIAVIERDIDTVRDFGLGGVVIGPSRQDGRLDREALARLLARCDGLGVTLHRAFDLTSDPFAALETAIELGFDRILTSGQAPTAAEGAALLARLEAAAAGRVVILAAVDIDADNVGALLEATSVREVHATCTGPAEARPPGADRFGFGFPPQSAETQRVARLVAAANGALVGPSPSPPPSRDP
jgi:copper homeostasis protein